MITTKEKKEYFKKVRKFEEYKIKILKMSGYIADHYIDSAIELEDFSEISSFLISYFAGGLSIDVGYLISKYDEFGLNEKVESLDFNINEWYMLKHEMENIKNIDHTIHLSEEEYVQYMIDKRKKEINE